MTAAAGANERHSEAQDASLIADPIERARREAKNGLVQFDLVDKYLEQSLDPERPFRLRISTILALHRAALDGLHSYAGNFRPSNVTIGGSAHQPPPAFQVPELVEAMCDYVNEKWSARSPLHLCAYTMWRLNWIHPFSDGNGRTSRAISYLVPCARLGTRLPGQKTIPEQIESNKAPYYAALEAADASEKSGDIDLGTLESLLSGYLAKQLVAVQEIAMGRPT